MPEAIPKKFTHKQTRQHKNFFLPTLFLGETIPSESCTDDMHAKTSTEILITPVFGACISLQPCQWRQNLEPLTLSEKCEYACDRLPALSDCFDIHGPTRLGG